MKLVNKLVLTFTVVSLVSIFIASRWLNNEVRMTYSELIEETLTSKASYIASQLSNKKLNSKSIKDLSEIFDLYKNKINPGAIQNYKNQNSFNIYVTNKKGIVLYHSLSPGEVGKDYSQWNDVYLTLKGEYGARSSRLEEKNPLSSVFYIAAPVFFKGKIQGVVSVFQPELSLDHILRKSKSKIVMVFIIFVSFILLIIVASFYWITKPFEKLKNYITQSSEKRAGPMPVLPAGEFEELGNAVKSMKDSIDNKNMIENHVQNLIHELKSPLTAISASGEIILDETKDETIGRFSENILTESSRIKNLLNSLLNISKLEKLPHLEKNEEIELAKFCRLIFDDLSSTIKLRGDQYTISGNSIIRVNQELLYQAFRNIIQNILDHAKAPSVIEVQILDGPETTQIYFRNTGSNLPDYALDKLFDKYYSLPTESTQRKGTGLGLSFVKEVMELHFGEISAQNQADNFQILVTIPVKSRL